MLSDDAAIGQATLERHVVQAHGVITVGRGDEVEQWISLVIIRPARGEDFAVGRRYAQDGAQPRVEAERTAIDDDALALFRAEAEEIVAVVVALAVDGGVHRYGLRLVGA